MHIVETARLVLRNFRRDDAAALLAYLQDPRVGCFLSLRLEDIAAAEGEAEKRGKSDDYVAVCLKGTDRPIGDLFCIPEESDPGELPDTYGVGWNFNAEFASAGYATEAARALFEHLFAVMHARRLYAYVEEDNIPSQRLCERLGMRKEGLFREYVSFRKDDTGVPIYENTMQYAILRKEWAR